MIRAVAFDIGGVLEITPPTGFTAKWEARLDLAPGDLDAGLREVWEAGSLGRITEEDVHRDIARILQVDAATVDAFMADAWTEYLGTLNVDLTAYFSGLRPRYRTAIISNSFVGAAARERERYHFDEITDVIVYSHEVGISKPDRRIYELTLERLGVEPAEMIFLDDTPAAVEAARGLGIHGIVFRDNAQAIADIEARLRATA